MPVRSEMLLQVAASGAFAAGTPRRIAVRHRYRRSDLEAWAMDRATRAGATYLDDFVEGRALPNDDGSMTLTSERDDRRIRATVMVLCEGADPRIPLLVKLRPDYAPDDQLHFGRTILHGRPIDAVMHGMWRTGWGMPVDVAMYPQQDGTLVSVVTRIENIMRASRSSKDALEDLLASSAFRSLGIDGDPGDAGMELVAIRSRFRDIPFEHDRLAMGIDLSGVLDPRRLDRPELTIAAGRHLAAYLMERRLGLEEWPEAAMAFIRDAVGPAPAYHDDRNTGYLEEGPPDGPGHAIRRMAGLLRRGSRAMTGSGQE
jgi:hypothetical protein